MNYHQPVLLKESLEALNINPRGIYVDLTFGGGGHARAILNKLGKGRLIAFDQDADASSNGIDDDRLLFIRGNFRYMKNFLRYHEIDAVDGLFADLGVSSHQFDVPGRGFSYRFDDRLDMRMNQEAPFTATDLLARYDQDALTRVFADYGELKNASRIAAVIIRARQEEKLETSGDLLSVIEPLITAKNRNKILSRVFQALRIEVNDELNALKELLIQSVDTLKKGGRLVIIAYHSLEDRLVKNFTRSGNFEGTIEKDLYGRSGQPLQPLSRSVITPGEEEVRRNPRARSAKMRVAEKL